MDKRLWNKREFSKVDTTYFVMFVATGDLVHCCEEWEIEESYRHWNGRNRKEWHLVVNRTTWRSKKKKKSSKVDLQD